MDSKRSPGQTLARAISRAAPLALTIALAGCGGPDPAMLLNQRPVVRLTQAPVSSARPDARHYAMTLDWVGFDPDGRVSHFLYAVDPPDSADTAWVRTERNEAVLLFPATHSDSATGIADDPHVFVVKAVDNRDTPSAPVHRAFFSKTIAPSVRIVSPAATSAARKYLTPALRIRWEGEDLDGVFTRKPVKYKYILLSEQSEVPLSEALVSPASVRRHWAPNFAGWDSISGDTTEVSYTNLVPDQEYMFVVVAFDEAGAWSPVFSRDQNMLYFRVTFAGNHNPRIHIWNQFFDYAFTAGSFEPDNRDAYIKIEVPAGDPVDFSWFAVANDGGEMRAYRWALDLLDLDDETPRSGPDDTYHWSAWALGTVSATLGPFAGTSTPHHFYLEAQDINGLVSLAVVEFTVADVTGGKPLLIVKDTRFDPDKRSPGEPCMDRPRGRWPSQAELDTFLFAQGGAAWKCYSGGVRTRPGLFSGYSYDTLGTRSPTKNWTVSLAKLGRYDHIIWITDRGGASVPSNQDQPSLPMPTTALGWMCSRNHMNTLGAYLKRGGRVWLVGGGAMTASVLDFDNTANNMVGTTPGLTFSSEFGELVPGRMAYDFARWQSEFKPAKATVQFRRALGLNAGDAFWSDPALPERLDRHSLAAGDSFPPNRTVTNGDFYYNDFDLEYLSRPNPYFEDADPGPGETLVPALDTLYQATGPTLVKPADNPVNVCMTSWPARSLWGVGGRPVGPALVASGFDLWSFQRGECRSLVDFVLQRMWGLAPAPGASLARTGAARPGTAGAARAAPAARQGIGAKRRR